MLRILLCILNKFCFSIKKKNILIYCSKFIIIFLFTFIVSSSFRIGILPFGLTAMHHNDWICMCPITLFYLSGLTMYKINYLHPTFIQL
jgi:hypothetical protein